MTSLRGRFVAVGLLAALAVVARAGDAESQKLLIEAQKHWNDPTPVEALRLGDQALAAQPTNLALEVNVRLFLGSLHQVKTGDFDKALAQYDSIINKLAGTQDPLLKQLKADAMVRKGTILYSEKSDAQAALRLYQSAHETYQLSTTADTASQLAFRLGREPARPAADKKTLMDLALGLAREAVTLAPRQYTAPTETDRQARNLAKVKLQLVIVQTALGMSDAAATTWGEIVQDKLGDQCLYQLGVLHALKGEADQATEVLKRSLHLPIRSSPRSRNDLRKFVRTEPDFATLRTRTDWAELITDEPL